MGRCLLFPLVLCVEALQSRDDALAAFYKAELTTLQNTTETFDLSPRGSQYEQVAVNGGDRFVETESNEAEMRHEQLKEGTVLKCVGWRAVKGCKPEGGKRDQSKDMGCGDWIVDGQAGWCECEYGFITRETGCRHEMFKCQDMCRHHSRSEGHLKQESADIAETIKTEKMVAEFKANGILEYSSGTINQRLAANKPFCIFLLCDCQEEIKWPVQELVAQNEWNMLNEKLLIGYARTPAATSWQLYDNFAIDGGPALTIDNIPEGQNLEKFVMRHEDGGGQLMARPELGLRPPRPVTADEIVGGCIIIVRQQHGRPYPPVTWHAAVLILHVSMPLPLLLPSLLPLPSSASFAARSSSASRFHARVSE
jgi:hypothetical protein